ncbi:MAG: branched-chain amino acid ABC transporter permease [Deltaproteobacteria bacterium]|nr:branched-chain amino acid ABC transporter permease [Deltaproteobacteria bacterium]
MDLQSQIIQYLVTGLTLGSIYAMVGLGFTIIYNATGIINLAQGEFVMFGGLIMVFLTATLRIPMVLAFFITLALVTIIGMIYERVFINPLKQTSLITLIIVTVAVSIFFRGIAMFIWGKEPYSLPPFSSGKPILFAGAAILPQVFWVLGLSLLTVILMNLFFNRTITGKAMSACAGNRLAASLVGINVSKMILLSFALSATLGAIAGASITPIALMEYDRGPLLALKGFCAAVLGGLGLGTGAVVAGFIIGIIESFSAGFISSGFKDAIALIILILVLFIKPSGLFGSEEVGKVKQF